MENLNLRTAVKRTVVYTEVTVVQDEEIKTYVVQGETTAKKELRKILKNTSDDVIPQVSVKVVVEKRAMPLDKFIEHSIVYEE